MHIPSDEWVNQVRSVKNEDGDRARGSIDQDIAMLLRRIERSRATSGASRIAATAGMKSWPE